MEIGEFVHTIRGKLGFVSRQKVPDLIAPPRPTVSKESSKAKIPQPQAVVTIVKPGMNEIKKLPELKVNPAEFNQRNKN